jgi:hypothetical protein
LAAAPSGAETIRDPVWACDDTKFTCSPICIQTAGKVTVQVQKSLCKEPVDPCLCNDVCYYDVQWEKQGGEVQCVASQRGRAENVADLVCEFRGARKPTAEEWNKRDVQKGTRGTYPKNLDECWQEEGDNIKFVDSLGAVTSLAALVAWLLA